MCRCLDLLVVNQVLRNAQWVAGRADQVAPKLCHKQACVLGAKKAGEVDLDALAVELFLLQSVEVNNMGHDSTSA